MAQKARKAEGFLPLTPAVFHILLALSDEKRHGLGIMSEVEGRTLGAVRLGPGTLYGTIKKLVADGLIEQTDTRPDPALDDQRRKYYRLTALGASVCAAEIQRLANLVERTSHPAPVRLLGELS